jgi:hypothetical protein
MPVSKEEDRMLSKAARSAIAKSPLDISELNIECHGGFIELGGKVRQPRGHQGHMDVRKEFKVLLTIINSVRGIKGCYGERVAIIDK